MTVSLSNAMDIKKNGHYDNEKAKRKHVCFSKCSVLLSESITLLDLIQCSNKELTAHQVNISDYSYKELKGCYR